MQNTILFPSIAICFLLISCSEISSTEHSKSDGTASYAIIKSTAKNKYTDTNKNSKNQKNYKFRSYENLPDGYAAIFKPSIDAQEYYKKYIKDIDRAYFDLSQGNYSRASEAFRQIGSETLFETPNDASWAGHGEALCRAGLKKEGVAKLKNAQCSLSLMSENLTCSQLDLIQEKPDFPRECYREYCEAEILRPDYDGTSASAVPAEYKARLNGYAAYLDKVAALCR
jgi:hypothetical protein